MPRLLNPKHEAFCRAYVRGPYSFHPADAYEAAGYARDRANAGRLLHQPATIARIAELREGEEAAERERARAALAAGAVNKARIVAELAAIAFADPLACVITGADGTLTIDAERLGHAARSGGAPVDVSVQCASMPGGKPTVWLRSRVSDKFKALAALERQIELAQEPADPPHDARAVRPTPEQALDGVVERLRDMHAHGVDVMEMARRAVAATLAEDDATDPNEVKQSQTQQDQTQTQQAETAKTDERERAGHPVHHEGDFVHGAERQSDGPCGHHARVEPVIAPSPGMAVPGAASHSDHDGPPPATTEINCEGEGSRDPGAARGSGNDDSDTRGPHLPRAGSAYLATVLSMPD